MAGGTSYLVTSLGTGDYSEVPYRLNGEIFKSRFASVALGQVLKLGGARALVFGTTDAEKKWRDPITEELSSAGLCVDFVPIAVGRNIDEILSIVDAVCQNVAAPAKVFLDVTHSLRHLPFVYLAALNYLVGLSDVDLGGIYYGAYELKDTDNVCPIINISSLFELTEWYQALQSFKSSGNLSPLATQVRRSCKLFYESGAPDVEINKAKGLLEQLSLTLAAGFPIEVGMLSGRLLDVLQGMKASGGRSLAARLAVKSLTEHLERFALPSGIASKNEVVLDDAELKRQLALIEWLTGYADVPKALLLLREWMLSLVLMHRFEPGSRWVEYDVRKDAERLLNTLAKRASEGLLDGDDKEFASLWSKLSTLRNRIAHAGMTGYGSKPASVDDLECCVKLATQFLQQPPAVLTRKPEQYRMVLCPLGFRKGILFSAATAIPAEEFVVIASRESSGGVDEALDRAGYKGGNRRLCVLEDAHGGFDEHRKFLREGLRLALSKTSELTAVVTGGTTAMQYVIERLAEDAQGLGPRVRRVAVIDRRSPEQQIDDPYIQAEIREL